MRDQEWLTLDEGAKHLRISRATLDRWIAEERVRAYELPSGRGRRVKRDDLDDVLVQKRLSLNELQPKMAEFAVYNGGNVEFREIAVMVRDASADQGTWPLQIVERSLSKAEASNPSTTFRGRLIRQARLALLEYVNQMEPRAAS